MRNKFPPDLFEYDDEIATRRWLADGLLDFVELLCGFSAGRDFMHANDGGIFDKWHN